MRFSRRITGLLAAAAVAFSTPALAGEIIYKSKNKIDFIKLDGAKKAEKEGGIDHPHTFTADQMKAILSSIKFNKKILLLKDIENRELFDEKNVEFLTPYLVDAFQKAKPEEVVVVSYFTRDSKLVIQNDRLTVMRAFVKTDGLHIKFTKIYAKLLGDRTTQGAASASAQARGLRVTLELQEGQNRISWDPEELVFDLSRFSGAAVAEKAEPVKKGKGKKEKEGKEIVAEEAVKPSKKSASAPEASGEKTVRDRLKELDQLKADALISDKEYQAKRKELLKEL
ncbi:MAG TPA: hypothetical protein VLJ37_01745 [bacterium]|nr:hypothetical protein [bacterium]